MLANDLISNLSVTDDMVRLSDLFTDTGAKGEEIVLKAPAPGKSMQISSYQLEKIATKYSLDWEKPEYLKRVKLTREGTAVKIGDIQQIIKDQLDAEGISDDVAVKIFGHRKGVYLPVTADIYDIEITEMEVSDRQDRFSATLNLPIGNDESKTLRITGSIDQIEAIPVFARTIKPGEVISEDDITWQDVSIKRISNRTISSANALIGQTVKRPIKAGKILVASDVQTPVAIAKGEQLTLIYKVGSMQLTAGARALENGGVGDIINVMNLQSRQSVEAKITSPGLATVSTHNVLTLASR
ncbi:flagellar basal body P-ring formation chaperone FlgA [Kordiimonas sp. SCSIO 12610]|uniref:flagellar basal body P-ring formation chaperone FlgA n=1 Tax=Kordiimonas sp. SCSIO 12610 TaxID=2829597 RepID=UPI00210E3DBB|nr:flagellar basal body P-ring formation chaperone FlgA [Kordiimonas sp. SCSIO 12610]UTW54182.1 flagellar basal body P-ring formation protein FlgA [Kordiimonas sp. SCSIO 12610]